MRALDGARWNRFGSSTLRTLCVGSDWPASSSWKTFSRELSERVRIEKRGVRRRKKSVRIRASTLNSFLLPEGETGKKELFSSAHVHVRAHLMREARLSRRAAVGEASALSLRTRWHCRRKETMTATRSNSLEREREVVSSPSSTNFSLERGRGGNGSEMEREISSLGRMKEKSNEKRGGRRIWAAVKTYFLTLDSSFIFLPPSEQADRGSKHNCRIKRHLKPGRQRRERKRERMQTER